MATQAALARFIDRGLLARHIRILAHEYRKRYRQLVPSLELRLGDRLRVLPSAAGLHVTAALVARGPADVAQAVRRAEARGVRVSSLASFCAEGPARAGIVIGFGAIPAARIDEGIRLLAARFGRRAEQ